MSRLLSLTRRILDDSAIFAGSDCPFALRLHPGSSDSRVLIVIGDNASGKSLFFQVLAGRARQDGAAPMTVSIRERTGSGCSDVSGMRRLFMYGDESEQSTGATSLRTLQSAFSSATAWAKDGKKPLVMLDEPDIGLSESYAAAMGTYLARCSTELPENAQLVLVTHSRALVAAFRREHRARTQTEPDFLVCGDELTPEEWLAPPPPKSVDDLLALPNVGAERRRGVRRLLDDATDRKRAKHGA